MYLDTLPTGAMSDATIDRGLRPQGAAQAGPTVIVGLGRTGLACARFLSQRGIDLQVVDSRAEPPELAACKASLPTIPLSLGRLDEALLERAATLVVSPGIAVGEPAIQRAAARGVPIVGDIELFARAAQAPVVAITGSNGKSTVTALLGAMAQAEGLDVRAGGNLGPPALTLLEPPGADLYVLELSSFQLETTHSLRPVVATVLNISEDHLDRHRDLESYVAAKRRIFAGAGIQVLNLDDARVAAMALAERPVVGFTLQIPAEGVFGLLPRAGGSWLAKGNRPLLPVSALHIPGLANVANALAALALGEAVGLSMAAMREALRRFRGLPHRLQWVANLDGVDWYDDSKATNVGATIAAIGGFGAARQLILIAGGDSKGADFQSLRDPAAQSVRAMVLIGRDAPRLEEALKDVVSVVRASGMTKACRRARELAQPGDAVLLSPACASFDMYRDYQERGEDFVAAVRSMSQ